jgi:two-component sensor histidine kinase
MDGSSETEKEAVVEPAPAGADQKVQHAELSRCVRQQELLTDLGVRALQNVSFEELLNKAAELSAEGVGGDYTKIMEHIPEEGRLVVRAGHGWPPGVVGVASVGADLASPGGYALRTGKPVISNHLENEQRFRTPELLARHGVRRAMNVILKGDRTPYGVLEVDSRSDGEFASQDLVFLQGAANILGMAIERRGREESLRNALGRQRLLLREINHRVKNSLGIVSSMLLLQAASEEDDRLKGELEQAANRVNTIARAHSRLYQTSDFERLDVGAYVKEICTDLPVPAEKKVLVEAPTGLILSTDRAVSFALIIVELVTNALKYAYDGEEGSVWVDLSREKNSLVAIVRDTGKGLPESFAPKNSRGLGMRIVLGLAEQLDAELTIRRRDKGAEFELRAPLQRNS